MRSLPGPIRELPDRDRIGLARRAHQRRRNIELTGWTEAPRGGEGLTCEASKRLGHREIRIVMRLEPFHRYLDQRWIGPNEDRLVGGRQVGVGTAGDGEPDASRRGLRRTSL